MFVRKSKYEEVKEELDTEKTAKLRLTIEYHRLIDKYNDLVRWINRCGGIKGIEQGIASSSSNQFTTDEIKTLIRLCHPDKHNGSDSANRITTKLLKMRK
jgi:hypothetical protein